VPARVARPGNGLAGLDRLIIALQTPLRCRSASNPACPRRKAPTSSRRRKRVRAAPGRRAEHFEIVAGEIAEETGSEILPSRTMAFSKRCGRSQVERFRGRRSLTRPCSPVRRPSLSASWRASNRVLAEVCPGQSLLLGLLPERATGHRHPRAGHSPTRKSHRSFAGISRRRLSQNSDLASSLLGECRGDTTSRRRFSRRQTNAERQRPISSFARHRYRL
jgi:hypothetical protein